MKKTILSFLTSLLIIPILSVNIAKASEALPLLLNLTNISQRVKNNMGLLVIQRLF